MSEAFSSLFSCGFPPLYCVFVFCHAVALLKMTQQAPGSPHLLKLLEGTGRQNWNVQLMPKGKA
jgi:hypothetical protein